MEFWWWYAGLVAVGLLANVVLLFLLAHSDFKGIHTVRLDANASGGLRREMSFEFNQGLDTGVRRMVMILVVVPVGLLLFSAYWLLDFKGEVDSTLELRAQAGKLFSRGGEAPSRRRGHAAPLRHTRNRDLGVTQGLWLQREPLR